MNPKTALLEAIAGKNRGLLVSERDRVRILSAIEQLEDSNPTPQPLDAKALLEGDWRLLYTTSRTILGLDRFPVLNLGQVYQCIRTAEARVYNIAEIVGLPFLEGLVSAAATFERVSERRVNVKFDRYLLGLQRLLGYRSPHRLVEELEGGKKFPPFDFSLSGRESGGWLEITYLDEDLRLSRGNEGNVFVLAREKGS